MRIGHFVIVGLSVFCSASAFAYELAPSTSPSVTGPEVEELQKISRGIAAVAKEAKKALVFVSIEKTIQASPAGNPLEFFFGPGMRPQAPGNPAAPAERKLSGLGSGFIVDLDKGYILTNNHVIDDADEIHLKMSNDRTYSGIVVGRDKRTDVAVVQIKDRKFDRTGLAALILDDSDQVNVGDIAIALGAPFGLESSLSFGVVSAIGRDDLQITDIGSFIQTDAAINRGNSGGPLLNAKGKVIGINTAITSPTGTYAGIGFSVPSNVARDIASRLINDGKVDRGFIGIAMQNLDDELAKELRVPTTNGALITNVEASSPAAKAGLRSKDVVTEIDGRKISNMSVVRNTVGLKKPGSTVNVAYYRQGKLQNTKISIGAFKDPNQPLAANQPDQGETKPGSTLGPAGMRLEALNKELGQNYGLTSTKGALITEVAAGSSAEAAGLQAGDVITDIDDREISTPKEAEKLLGKNSGKKSSLLRIERQGIYSFRRLNLDNTPGG